MGVKRIALLVAVTFLASGCAAHRTTTLAQDWSAGAGDRVLLVDGGEEVFTGAGKQVTLYDGSTGEVVWSEQEERSLGKALLSSGTFRLGGAELTPGDYEADEYSTVVLEEERALVVMDFGMTKDRIRALDLDTGQELWSSEDYTFTLKRYEALADVLGSTGNPLGRMAGREVDSHVAEEAAFYLEDLVLPVPQADAFLFKTRAGLELVDARTGESRWVANEIDGLGIAAAVTLRGEDEILVANYAPRGNQPRQLARIDLASGAVHWIAEYSSPSSPPSWTRSLDLERVGDQVVLVGHGVEVFDYRSGARLWQSHDEETMRRQPWAAVWGRTVAGPVIDDGALYLVDNTAPNSFRCIGDCNSIVRKYDLSTGDVLWTSQDFEGVTAIRDLELMEGTLVAALSAPDYERVASRVVGLEPASGQVRWSSPEGRTHLRDLIPDGPHVIALLGDTLYRLDARSGAVAARTSFEEAGVGGPLHDLVDAGDRVVVPGSWGVASFDKAKLRPLFARTFRPQDQPEWEELGFFARMKVLMSPAKDDGVNGAAVAGDKILLHRDAGGMTIVDGGTGEVVGDLTASLGRGDRRSGPLGRDGFRVSDDARYLYVYGAGTVSRYQLEP